jgi:hypothetical protein
MIAQFTRDIGVVEGPDREWLSYEEMLDEDNYGFLDAI